jgi:hypothetical protein
MTAVTTDLAGFLLARIAEDEAVALEAGGEDWEQADGRKVRWLRNGGNAHGWVAFVDLPTATAHIARHDPARVLAECEAKRRIVEYAEMLNGQAAHQGGEVAGYHATGLGIAIRLLAEPYATHPDYRAEWRP